MNKCVFQVTQLAKEPTKLQVDLEEALDIAKSGRYQLWHSGLMLLILTAALLEMVGCSFVIPAAVCDLQISPSLMGIIASIPNIGVILTASAWGRAADTLGRRPTLQVSTAVAGALGMAASLMPGVTTYTICKFTASLFLSCPSSLCFAFAGEMLPKKKRDRAILLLSAFLMYSTMVLPLIAWGVLSNDWISSSTIRPWRILNMVYALPLLISSALLYHCQESPKFLVTRGKEQAAMQVLQIIFSSNTGLPKEQYPVSSLRIPTTDICNNLDDKLQHSQPALATSSLTLFKPPNLKWMAVTGFLMFGVFSSLNGLFIFAPDTINRVLSEHSAEEVAICSLMQHAHGQVSNATCTDSISPRTFHVSMASTALYASIVLAVSLCPISKRMLLVVTFFITGVGCLTAGLVKHRLLSAIAMSALQFSSLGIGPLTALAVDLFPTHLRGSAVGAVLMFGRVGSVVGANFAGALLISACNTTFIGFAVLLFGCCALSFILPKDQKSPEALQLNTYI